MGIDDFRTSDEYKNQNNKILDEIKNFKKFNYNNQNEKIIDKETIIEKITPVKKDNIKDKNEIVIEKLQFNPGLILNEKNTAITSDNNNIYISSDSNKAIICINPQNGKLKWIFNHQDLNKITSAVTSFKNKLIFANPDNIFILNYNGKLDSIIKIKNGSIYWPNNIIIQNNLYIPTSNTIYKYNGETLIKLDNFPDTMGQLYISSYLDNLLCFNLNEKNIIFYNLNNNNMDYISNKINNRAFMSPICPEGDYLYIADSVSNIYRFNIKNKNPDPEILKFNTGIMSSLIYDNNHLYFIANDGYLYKLKLSLFNTPYKIKQIDIKPNSNKYLTKNILKNNNYLYYATDTNNIFYYNLINNKYDMLPISENNDIPLIGSPVKINEYIYFIDIRSNIYKIKSL